MFIANTPGHVCATAIRSVNKSLSTHLFFCTTSASIRGIIAYPPPSVKAPILKKVIKSLPKSPFEDFLSVTLFIDVDKLSGSIKNNYINYK